MSAPCAPSDFLRKRTSSLFSASVKQRDLEVHGPAQHGLMGCFRAELCDWASVSGAALSQCAAAGPSGSPLGKTRGSHHLWVNIGVSTSFQRLVLHPTYNIQPELQVRISVSTDFVTNKAFKKGRFVQLATYYSWLNSECKGASRSTF
jgi:hypothetical protein